MRLAEIMNPLARPAARPDLARHGAHTFHGLLTRTAATIAAHTIGKVVLART